MSLRAACRGHYGPARLPLPRRAAAVAAAVLLLAGACAEETPVGPVAEPTTAPVGLPPGDGASGPARGQALFTSTCQVCHGPGAVGLAGLGKNLVESEFVNATGDADLVAFIAAGRPPSDPANTTGIAMPPRGGNPSLSDTDLADIVGYLRTLP